MIYQIAKVAYEVVREYGYLHLGRAWEDWSRASQETRDIMIQGIKLAQREPHLQYLEFMDVWLRATDGLVTDIGISDKASVRLFLTVARSSQSKEKA